VLLSGREKRTCKSQHCTVTYNWQVGTYKLEYKLNTRVFFALLGTNSNITGNRKTVSSLGFLCATKIYEHLHPFHQCLLPGSRSSSQARVAIVEEEARLKKGHSLQTLNEIG
jgi:hypothetical protein